MTTYRYSIEFGSFGSLKWNYKNRTHRSYMLYHIKNNRISMCRAGTDYTMVVL